MRFFEIQPEKDQLTEGLPNATEEELILIESAALTDPEIIRLYEANDSPPFPPEKYFDPNRPDHVKFYQYWVYAFEQFNIGSKKRLQEIREKEKNRVMNRGQ